MGSHPHRGRLVRCGVAGRTELVRKSVCNVGVFLVSLILALQIISQCRAVHFQCHALDECMEKYQTTKKALGIKDELDNQLHSTDCTTSSHDHRQKLCVASRSLNSCLLKEKVVCHGILNFHQMKKGVDRILDYCNCSLVEDSTAVFNDSQTFVSMDQPREETACVFEVESGYRVCSLFGDPHLRTFTGAYQTCRVDGAWPLIDNENFTVQTTSRAIGVGTGTTITKVTVVVKRNVECASQDYLLYQAQSGDLPTSFDGLDDLELNGIEITELIPNRHVEISLDYLGVTIIVRQTGLYYSVSISIPLTEHALSPKSSSSAASAVQLCWTGCPSSQQVSLDEYFRQAPLKRKQLVFVSMDDARSRCKNGRDVRDFYSNACVFDLMTTGDLNFTLAAQGARHDFHRFSFTNELETWNRTGVFQPTSSKRSSSGVAWRTFWTVAIVSSLVLLFQPGVDSKSWSCYSNLE